MTEPGKLLDVGAVSDEVAFGPGLAVAGHGDHDQAVVHAAKHVVAEVQVVHDLRAEVLDHDIGLGGQAEK